jgi:hypothetical protein
MDLVLANALENKSKGSQPEGVFRNHRIKSDGSIHDNVFYSIIDTEWPNVKENLHYLLTQLSQLSAPNKPLI